MLRDMSDVPKKPKLPRKIKIILWTAGLALAYTLAGFFLAPALIKSQMLKRLPALIHRQAAIREVTFNPFTFALAVQGLLLTETNGAAFAGWDEFHFQFQALASLSRRAWVFQDVTLTHPFAHVIRRKDGSFNFDNLMETNAAAGAKPAPASALPAVLVQSLRFLGARLEADDLTGAAVFHDKLAPINLQLTNFTTMSNTASPFVCSAATDAGEKFEASGQITLQPLQSSGNVKIAGVDLKRYGPYLAAFTRAELIDGKVDVAANYQFALGPQGPDATVTNGTVQLANLRVKSPDSGETVVSIPTLAVILDEASLGRRAVHVSSIKSSGGSLLIRQNHDGTVNLPALMPPPAPAAAPSSAPAAAAPWTAQADEIAFDGYKLAVEDQKPEHPVKLDVSALAFTIKGFHSASNTPLATAMSMRLNGQGSLSINGTVALAPFSGDLALELAGLELPPFAPYLPSQIRIALSKGQLSVHGRAQGALTSDGPAGSFAGDVSVKNIATADLRHDRNLIKFDALTVIGIKASYPAVKLQIEEVALAGFNANVVIDTNGQINLLAVLSNNAPNPAAAPASPSAPATPIDLGALVIEKASFHYVDESIEPQATFDVQELSGTIKGLSTHPQGPATVDFRGKVDPFSPYSISGSVDPLAKDISLNLAVSVKNVDLTCLTPYMEKYGGYPLNKGKVLLQLKYDLARRNLAASNKVVIADLTLGARNNSATATHLPVKLGIALLKDREGRIDLDVPVTGSLDDPNFKIGPVIFQVVQNLLAKAATSPFTLLGKVLGGGGEELSSVDFAPGEAVLAPSEQTKLQKLAKALYERPALTLQIAGACAPAADSAVLARRHLQRRVNKLRGDEQAAAGQAVQSVESIKLEPADYARLLQKLYERTFGTMGTNQAESSPSNIPPATAKPAPEKASGHAPELVYVPSVPEAHPWGRVRFEKGGERLMRHEAARRTPPLAAAPKPVAPVQGPANTAPVTPSAPDLAQMEQRLLGEIRVTDDELRELEQMRARAVQTALLASGRIPPERVFILAAKPINAAAAGEARANFSLE
jgi:uncharacterized protein involved in outer membrane biogenesis